MGTDLVRRQVSAAGTIDVQLLAAGEEATLERVAAGVFDRPVVPGQVRELLADRRHHLAVALDGGLVVGMASAIDYLHADKPAELWIDEVGVAASHRGRGIGRRLLMALFEVGRTAGCRQAWVLAEQGNRAARRLYRAVGGVETSREQVLVEFALAASGDGDPPGATTEPRE